MNSVNIMKKSVKKILYSALIFSFILGLNFSIASAQEAVLVATVNIYEARIISQDENTINLSFDISNREGAQSQIKYGVQLIEQKEDGNQILVDTKVYNEEFSLAENTTVSREITYIAPDYLNGTYQIWIISKNANGLLLALNMVGKIELNSIKEYIEILTDKCFLQVKEEEENPQYTISQGVDISSEETLQMTCDVVNHFNTDKTFAPSFKTFHRSQFGKEIEHIDIAQEIFNLQAEEQTTISFELPKATESQSYDINLIFEDTKGNNVSNSVSIHYVLRGESATIQNITLDKNFYNKGDIATVSFFGTLAADNFPLARGGYTILDNIIVIVEIIDEKGKICAEGLSQPLTLSNTKNEFQMKITERCVSPTINVLIVDEESGDELDSGSFVFLSDSKDKGEADIFMTALIILIIISIAVFIWRKKKKIESPMLSSILILIIASTGFFFSNLPEANADTLSVPITNNTNGIVGYLSVTLDIDNRNREYMLGELIIATASGTFAACANTIANLVISANYNGSGIRVDVKLIDQSSTGNINFYQKNYAFPAPTKYGPYSMNFSGTFSVYHITEGLLSSIMSTFSIPFTVLQPTGTLSTRLGPSCIIAPGNTTCSVDITVGTKNLPVQSIIR